MSDFDKFLTETYGVAQQAVGEGVQTAKSGLESFLDSFSSKQAPATSPSPQKPAVGAVKPADGGYDAGWVAINQKIQEDAPKVQAEMSQIKQAAQGEHLQETVKLLEKALSEKGVNGTTRGILKREYRDLTGKGYNAKGG